MSVVGLAAVQFTTIEVPVTLEKFMLVGAGGIIGVKIYFLPLAMATVFVLFTTV